MAVYLENALTMEAFQAVVRKKPPAPLHMFDV